MKVKVAQLYPTHCNPMDCVVHGILSILTGVGSLSLLQGIFPTQGWNPGLAHCRRILSQLSHLGSPGAWSKTIVTLIPRVNPNQGRGVGVGIRKKGPGRRGREAVPSEVPLTCSPAGLCPSWNQKGVKLRAPTFAMRGAPSGLCQVGTQPLQHVDTNIQKHMRFRPVKPSNTY